MKKLITLSIFAALNAMSANSQAAFTVLDENDCSAMIMDVGHFFNNPTTSSPGYEVPAGSGKHSIYSASMWFGGKDVNGQLKLAAQQFYPEQDFWPGALTVGDAVIVTPNPLGQTLWTVSKNEINDHINNYLSPGYTIPADIQNWPAHGDTTGSVNVGGQNYYAQSYNLAPFVDVDNDGDYNPSAGDYPCIKGDKAVYTIINDKGNIHSSGGDPIGIEIHYMFYQYSSVPGLEEITFLDAHVINRGTQTLNDFSTSFFADGDLGGATDDFVGCDSTRNLMFTYNADGFDETSNGNLGYDSLPPAVGVVCLSHDISSTGYYSNGGLAAPNTATGYYNLMRGKATDGSDLLDNNGLPTTFVFPGDPNDSNQWSEVNSLGFPASVPGDRRMLMSVDFGTILPFEEYDMTFAVVFAEGTDNLQSVAELYQVTDFVQDYYDNTMLADCYGSNVGVDELDVESITLYPNPSNGNFTLNFSEFVENMTITMNDMSGRVVYKQENMSGQKLELVTNVLPGVYIVKVTSGRGDVTLRVVVE